MKFGVIIFPGSNCDHDACWTIQAVAKQPVTFLWHESHNLENCDAIVVREGSRTATICERARSLSFLRLCNRCASSPRAGA